MNRTAKQALLTILTTLAAMTIWQVAILPRVQRTTV